ncbi:MAG: O-antigen ligase family protein [Deltaproteobacteria bacterium]|nr:O-antigen ligase family protein [Deltaproteobacteria bacterium]
MLLFLMARFLGPKPRPHYVVQIIFFALCFWIITADLLTLARMWNLVEFLHTGGRAVFFIFILTTYAVCRDLASYRRVLNLLVLGICLMAMFTIICAVFHINPLGAHQTDVAREFYGTAMPYGRTIGVLKSYGEYGLIINAALPLLLIAAWRKGFMVSRLLALISIGILLFALIITQSRNSWVATLMVMFFMSVFLAFRTRAAVWKILLILGGFLIIIIAVGWMSHRLERVYQGFALGKTSYHTFEGRLRMDSLAWHIFQAHPLFGVGHEEVTRQVTKLFGAETALHNGYLDQLASNGLFGFIPFLTLMLLTFFTLFKMARKAPEPLNWYALCLAASMVGSMTVLLGYKGFFSITFAIEYGLFLSLVELDHQAPAPDLLTIKAPMKDDGAPVTSAAQRPSYL